MCVVSAKRAVIVGRLCQMPILSLSSSRGPALGRDVKRLVRCLAQAPLQLSYFLKLLIDYRAVEAINGDAWFAAGRRDDGRRVKLIPLLACHTPCTGSLRRYVFS